MATRVTRSSTQATKNASMPPPPSPSLKRAAPARPSTPPPKKPRKSSSTSSPYVPPTPRTEQAILDSLHKQEEQGEKEGTVLLHPSLKFDYEDAKRHLISTDERWSVLMNALECKPFQGEQTEPFNPFKSLVSSILGQQVSWLAARSIQHKFCRIWSPHLPEKLPPPDSSIPRLEGPFPTPSQVVSLPDRRETLRSAGLSYRKVEYVTELAERFVDGRLDAKKLWDMDEEEVMKTLTEVRGIGVWTVHMFEIFAMKRQDILPVGDLGIQKNLCRWYSQDPSFVPSIHPRKLVGSPKKKRPSKTPSSTVKSEGEAEKEPKKEEGEEEDRLEEGVGKLDELGVSSVERGKVIELSTSFSVEPKQEPKDEEGQGTKEEEEELENLGFTFPETSNGLTPQVLKNRLSGKKIKGAYLTPLEMEELMKPWEPFRSVACWYLWSVTDKD
ncbi:hypothetical protein JCM16303_000438 [Sporobolomyces ruberrimus]